MDKWESEICRTIGHHAYVTYGDLEKEGPPARPLDFPAPIVHRGIRSTVHAYDPQRGEYHKIKNVLSRSRRASGSSQDYTNATRSNISRRSEKDDIIPDHDAIGYCLQKKIANTVYGGIYKGIVMRKRNLLCGEDAVIEDAFRDSKSSKNSLSSIMEDLELDDTTKENVVNHTTSNRRPNTVWEITNEQVIVKTSSWSKVRRLRGKHLEDPIKEIQCMQLIGNNNPHFVSHLEAMQDEHLLYNVMEYCEDGDLYGVVMSEISTNARVDESRARLWFRQLLIALHYLQQKGVCHRDLKLENIMVHEEQIKIVDFGLALRLPYQTVGHDGTMTYVTDVSEGSNRILMTFQGQGSNWGYMSPEVIGKDKYFDGFTHDLWAVGVILYIVLVGHKPFHWAHVSDMQFLQLSENGALKEILDYWDINLSDDACDLLQSMLNRSPHNRLTLAEVMKHKWVRGVKEKSIHPEENKQLKYETNTGKTKWLKKKQKKGNTKSSKR